MRTFTETFLDNLAQELRLRGVPVLRSELRGWVRDAWPLIEVDPFPGRWATAWQEQWRGVPVGADGCRTKIAALGRA
jgi:hypothetical protein